MGKHFVEILKQIACQAVAILPDIINWVTGTVLPVIPAPFNILVGILLRAVLAYLGGRRGPCATPEAP